MSRLRRAPWSWPGRLIRWLYNQPAEPGLWDPTPAPGPLLLELEADYPGGATGAVILRIELGELHELEAAGIGAVLPPGASGVRARIVTRAYLYAGATTTVDHESEPPPAFLRGTRL